TNGEGEATVEWTLPDNLSGIASLTAEIKDKEGDHLQGSPITFDTEVSLEKFLIEGSPWKLISRTVGDRDDFKFWNAGNIACGSERVLYDHKHRMIDGTWSFNAGGENIVN